MIFEVWKIYRLLPEFEGGRSRLSGVIDESGRITLSTSHFVQVMFPADVQEQLLQRWEKSLPNQGRLNGN